MTTEEVVHALVMRDAGFRPAVDCETTAQAAQRYGLKPHTLYRRLIRLIERGEIVIGPGDRVGSTLFLSAELWDRIVTETRRPGRPRKL